MLDEAEAGRSIMGERGSLQRAIVVPLGIGMLSFCLSAAPALFKRGHIIDDIKDGIAIPTAICATLFMLSITVPARGSFQRDANGNLLRDPSWRILGTIVATGLAMIVYFVGLDYWRAADLRTHGVATHARLVRLFDQECGKGGGCTIELEYSFVPQGRSEPTQGFARTAISSSQWEPDYDYVTSTGTVPIFYDPNLPSRSMASWGDKIVGPGSAKQALEMIALLAGALLAAISPLALGTWSIMRKRSTVGADAQAEA